jgi:hypothetical protein
MPRYPDSSTGCRSRLFLDKAKQRAEMKRKMAQGLIVI